MRNSGRTTPADRMAALVAAARSDDEAREAGTEQVPSRTGGWVPQIDSGDESRHRWVPQWLADRLPQSPRLGIAMGAGVIVLAVMLVAGGIFAVRFATAAPAAHPIASVTASPTPSGPGNRTTMATGPPAGTSAVPETATSPGTGDHGSAGTVTVQVVGAVHRPGVVTLPAGSRVIDAVKAAGGAGGKADTAAVNMARKVVDGEQIRLPRIGDDPDPAVPMSGRTTPAGPGVPADPGAGPATAQPAPVNLNTADEAALETLPNIGPVTAQKIIDWRTQNGGFSSVEDLLDVSGIGPKTFAELKDLVTV